MLELVYVLLVTGACCAVLTVLARWLEPAMRWFETTLTWISTAIIIGAMCFVCAEVVMRYGFNSPIPGHLEGAELLVPMIVFLAVSYTQSKNGHVGMTMVVEALSPRVRRITEIVTLALSMIVCATLAYFGFKYSYQLWEYDDVTMTPPYWRTWPSAAVIVLGYGMLAVRMWLQILHHFSPERFPAPPQEDSELYSFDA